MLCCVSSQHNALYIKYMGEVFSLQASARKKFFKFSSIFKKSEKNNFTKNKNNGLKNVTEILMIISTTSS